MIGWFWKPVLFYSKVDHWPGSDVQAEVRQRLAEMPGTVRFPGRNANEIFLIIRIYDIRKRNLPLRIIVKSLIARCRNHHRSLALAAAEPNNDVLLQHIVVLERPVSVLKKMNMSYCNPLH